MRKLSPAFLLVFLVSRPAGAGTVSGQVVLAKEGRVVPDASHAVVWIEGAPGGRSSPAKAAMTQESKRFLPRVLVVSKNGVVDFPNDDPIYHNVFSVSGANRFDLGLYRSGTSRSRKFEATGLVRVYCNIHPQMVGFVVVVDSGFSAVTGKDGAFRFENVPAGTWVVRAWHEEGGETSSPVTVDGDGGAPLVLRLDASGFRPEPHKNKYGKDYPPLPPSDERY